MAGPLSACAPAGLLSRPGSAHFLLTLAKCSEVAPAARQRPAGSQPPALLAGKCAEARPTRGRVVICCGSLAAAPGGRRRASSRAGSNPGECQEGQLAMQPVKNVVMIVSDTLRRDYLGCYGGTAARTPNVDALAGRSAVFERYYAGAFPTMPTRADYFLGKWTFTFMTWEPLPRNQTTLSQILTQAGIRTLAVVDTPFYVANGYGYDRGFQHFIELLTQPGRLAPL
ncbi:MAG: hypothetical protein C4345_12820 [Chloroflexota bacterium]